MACDVWDISCQAGSVIKDVANDSIKNMAQAIAEAVGNVIKTLGTFWVNVGTPSLTTSAAGGAPSDPVQFLQNSLYFWTAALAVLSVLVGAAKMVIERRGAPLRDLARSLATLVVVSGAGVAAVGLLTAAADQFSVWIIANSTSGTSFNENITAMLQLTGTSPIGSIMIILLGLIAILASVVQIVLMIVRGGLLVILTGIFPTAAAFTNTEAGKGWFQKCMAWLIAFILYKPAAAIVYATAFRLTGTKIFGNGNGDGKDFGSALVSTVTGLALMVIALVAMPALMRFVTPMVGAIAGGGGSMAAGAVAGAASGAVSMGSAGRGGGSSGASARASSSQGPSGTGSQGSAGAAGKAGSQASAASGSQAASAGASGGSAAAGGAAAGGGAAAAGAAAAGPVGVGVLAAQKGLEAGQAAAGAVKAVGEEQTGSA